MQRVKRKIKQTSQIIDWVNKLIIKAQYSGCTQATTTRKWRDERTDTQVLEKYTLIRQEAVCDCRCAHKAVRYPAGNCPIRRLPAEPRQGTRHQQPTGGDRERKRRCRVCPTHASNLRSPPSLPANNSIVACKSSLSDVGEPRNCAQRSMATCVYTFQLETVRWIRTPYFLLVLYPSTYSAFRFNLGLYFYLPFSLVYPHLGKQYISLVTVSLIRLYVES